MLAQSMLRLREKAMPPLLDVQGAFALGSLASPPPRTPVAYVALGRETAAANARVNGMAQRVTRQLAVIVVHGNKRDARGEAASIDMEEILGPVRLALHGWAPGDDHDVFTFVGGEPRQFEQFVLAHQYVFATETMMFGSPAEAAG